MTQIAIGPQMERPAGRWWLPWLLVGYTVAVHTLDTLALHLSLEGAPRAVLPWQLGGFDLLKFVAWFVIPLAFSVKGMDWGYLGFKRWRLIDFGLLLGLASAGIVAILAVRYIPSLHSFYPSQSGLSPEQKKFFLMYWLSWAGSWLIGWEFLHRYVLVRAFQESRPWLALMVVPLIEGGYHLGQKHWLEALAMTAFSFILCLWTLRRRNALLPFFAHLLIELELLAFLLLL